MTESPHKPLLASTWAELRRRKVVRAAIAYALIAWVVLQFGEIAFEPLGLPPRALTWTILLAILGFPVVLVLAWVFDRDGDGEVTVDRGGYAGPARLFALALVVLTVGGIGWWLSDVYPVAAPEAGRAQAPAKARPEGAAADALPANAIAVLPFDDMSPARDQGWFADGLAEELLDRLARVEGLHVAARTSSFAFRGSEHDVTSIGRLLNVGTVLEGSVRKGEGKVRVTAQLIDTNNGYHLWSEIYERPDQGIFELQDEITGTIVEQLRERIPGLRRAQQGAAEQATTVAASTTNVQAHELYLRGRLYWRQRTPTALAHAVELFEQAIERDPKYARAWSGLADARLLLSNYGLLTAAEAVEQAEPAVVQALTLAPGLGEAWASLGLLRLNAGQLDAAEGNFLEATRLDPNYDMAAMWLGGLYGRQGKLNAQADVLTKARDLSPLDPAINVNLAGNRLQRGDVEGARELLLHVLQATPDADLVLRTLADVERSVGHLAQALGYADRAWRADPENPNTLVSLAIALAALHRFDEAQRVLERIPGSHPTRPLFTYLVAMQRDARTPVPLEVSAMVERALEGDGPVGDEIRPLMQLAALSAYLAGEEERGLRILLRVVGTPGARPLLLDELPLASNAMFGLRMAGRDEDAQAWHAELSRRYAQLREQGWGGVYADYSEALLRVFEGDIQTASDLLVRAVAGGYGELWVLDVDPSWSALRDTAGFAKARADVAARVEREQRESFTIARY